MASAEYDYVVVGGGSAGCVVASRLSEDPANRVLLLEAGGPDRHPFMKMPAAFYELLKDTRLNWNYTSEAEAHAGNRRFPLQRGKVVIDTTNPIGGPPVGGVLQLFTGPNDSLMERLQRRAPKARFVKAFSCVGNAFMVNPDFGGQKPTMFICGSDAAAKTEVTKLLDQFGWETEDMGAVEAARAIEPLCMLWCIPGLTKGRWTHAFKLLKK